VINKSEFEEWQHHPVTKELFKHIAGQVEQAKEALATDAGTNPLADRDLVGGVAAFREVLDWIPEYPEEE
jgi:hypothetical protein